VEEWKEKDTAARNASPLVAYEKSDSATASEEDVHLRELERRKKDKTDVAHDGDGGLLMFLIMDRWRCGL